MAKALGQRVPPWATETLAPTFLALSCWDSHPLLPPVSSHFAQESCLVDEAGGVKSCEGPGRSSWH